jgi:hypothetical protein
MASSVKPYPLNPTKTLASAVDTLFKFGPDGNQIATAILLQNNSGSAINYALDKAVGAGTFTLADKTAIFIGPGIDIHVLHLSSASQQSVNDDGTAGICFQAWG